MDFGGLYQRFLEYLRDRVHSGELTERGLARLTGVSQPHIHHVLKGKRVLSVQKVDTILRHLNVDLVDLLEPEDLIRPRKQ